MEGQVDGTTWTTHLSKQKQVKLLEKEKQFEQKCWNRRYGCKDCPEKKCIDRWDCHC